MAELHSQLAQDCVLLGRFPLCRVLLMNDANYPWCILVPDRDGVTEIYELEDTDQLRLIRESSLIASRMAAEFGAHKMNVAALGNAVPQLHVHHIVRYRDDPAWPGPVWGKVPARPYAPAALQQATARIRDCLGDALAGP